VIWNHTRQTLCLLLFCPSLLLLAPHARVGPVAAGRELCPLQSSLHCGLDAFDPHDLLTPCSLILSPSGSSWEVSGKKATKPKPSANSGGFSAPAGRGRGGARGPRGECRHDVQSVECWSLFSQFAARGAIVRAGSDHRLHLLFGGMEVGACMTHTLTIDQIVMLSAQEQIVPRGGCRTGRGTTGTGETPRTTGAGAA
jgi:hypothetical protein